MSKYICKSCNYSTKNFCDIKKHINKKKLCYDNNNKSLINLSKDEILVFSIIPYNNDIQSIDDVRNIENISKNKEELFNILYDIDKKKIKNCSICNEKFNNVQKCKNHLILNCFMKNKNNNIITNSNNSNNNTITNSNNTNNTITNTNCITNNINNITIQIKNPIPFDDEWCTSHINKYHLEHFLFSKQMYTDLLKEILENELNLNVIIDKKKNNDIGWIYKNENDKYIMMNIKDIVENSIDKLYKKLKEINHETTQKSEVDINHLIPSKHIIREKYNKYKNNNNDIKNDVNNIISNIFETKKTEAFDIYNEINKNSSSILEY
jgi:hypothetical protein